MKNIKFAGLKQVITYLIVAITSCLFGLTNGYSGLGFAFAEETSEPKIMKFGVSVGEVGRVISITNNGEIYESLAIMAYDENDIILDMTYRDIAPSQTITVDISNLPEDTKMVAIEYYGEVSGNMFFIGELNNPNTKTIFRSGRITNTTCSFIHPLEKPSAPVNDCGLGGECIGNADNLHVGRDYSVNFDNIPAYSVNFGVLKQNIDYNTNNYNMGNTVVIEHLLSSGEKWLSLYAHLASKNLIGFPIKSRIAKKQTIGIVGCSGNTTCEYGTNNKHIHFELKKPDFGYEDLYPFGYMKTDEATALKNNYNLASNMTISEVINHLFSSIDTFNNDNKKILLPYFSNTNGNPTVNTKLTIDIPCIEFFDGTKYDFKLDYYKNPNDSSTSSHYFKLNNDLNEFELTPSCGASIDENLNISCVKTMLFDGLQYNIDLQYYDNPSDTKGFYWKLGKLEPITSISNYDVYGTSGEPLYASMMLNLVQDTSFKLIGIGGRDKNDKVVNILEPRDNILGPTSTSTLFGKRTFRCIDAAGCDYNFFAYIDKRLDLDSKEWVDVGNGYPVKMTILPNAQSEIIDNDGYNVDVPKGNSTKAQPGYYVANEKINTMSELNVAGYYLSANLFKGGNDQWARWFPTNAGKYQIYVHIPPGANANNVQYKISPEFVSANITSIDPTISDPISHSTEGWVQLKSGSGTNTNFTFKKGGYVGLSVNDIDSKTIVDNESVDTLIGVDAVKFIYVESDKLEPNLTLLLPCNCSSDDTTIDEIIVSTTTGTTTDNSAYYTTDTLYIDFAVLNNGTASVLNAFYIELYIDDVKYHFWKVNDKGTLPINYMFPFTDYSIGKLTSGMHKITIKIDPENNILESDETDNKFTKTITIK